MLYRYLAMTRGASAAVLSFIGSLSIACSGRPAGPLPDDRGRLTHWEITSARLGFEGCPDTQDFVDEFDDPAALVGTAISYEVAEDGRTAEWMICGSTDPSDCAPFEPPRRFTIQGSVLSADEPPFEVPAAGLDCSQIVNTTWTLTDRGETADWSVETRFDLVGTATACDTLEDVFRFDAPNGLGLRECAVTRSGRARYVDG